MPVNASRLCVVWAAALCAVAWTPAVSQGGDDLSGPPPAIPSGGQIKAGQTHSPTYTLTCHDISHPDGSYAHTRSSTFAFTVRNDSPHAVSYGFFLDGTPWVVAPEDGELTLLATRPERIDQALVFIRQRWRHAIQSSGRTWTLKAPLQAGDTMFDSWAITALSGDADDGVLTIHFAKAADAARFAAAGARQQRPELVVARQTIDWGDAQVQADTVVFGGDSGKALAQAGIGAKRLSGAIDTRHVGPVQQTVINPDFGLVARQAPRYDGDGEDVYSSDRTAIPHSAGLVMPFDFRGGINLRQEHVGSAYDAEQVWDRRPKGLAPGDMVVVQEADLDIGRYGGEPFTRAFGCLTVVHAAPPANAFRPPVNWDVSDKANRPIFTEVHAFAAIDLPGYRLSDDDPVDWSVRQADGRYHLLAGTTDELVPAGLRTKAGYLGTVIPHMICSTTVERGRATMMQQAVTPDEYPSYFANIDEEQALLALDPHVDEAWRDRYRRVLAQRGVDIWGAMYSQGKYLTGAGGHTQGYMPRVFWAWAVTGGVPADRAGHGRRPLDRMAMTDVLDLKYGNTDNGTRFAPHPVPGTDTGLSNNTSMFSEAPRFCRWRHRGLEATVVDATPGAMVLRIQRPLKPANYLNNPEARFPLDLYRRSNVWGMLGNRRTNNAGGFDGGWVRVDDQFVTRIGDGRPPRDLDAPPAHRFAETGGKGNADYVDLALAEDLPNATKGQHVTVDLSNYILEQVTGDRPIWIRHIVNNTDSTSFGGQAYTYATLNFILPLRIVCDQRGLDREELPVWAAHLHGYGSWIAQTPQGKQMYLNARNRRYNISNSALHDAALRQFCGQGVNVGVVRAEDPAAKVPLPQQKTWIDIADNYPDNIQCYLYGPVRGGRREHRLFDYADNKEIATGKGRKRRMTCSHISSDPASYHEDGRPIIRLAGEGVVSWSHFANRVAYVWLSGTEAPLKLERLSTTATDGEATDWKAAYVPVDPQRKRFAGYGSKLLENGMIMFFADP